MVDVGEKTLTNRVCVARGAVRMSAETVDLVVGGRAPKGDVLATARIAGIQAAKRTSEWIPLCHSLPLDSVDIELQPDRAEGRILIEAHARAHARTGVEMEALVAVSAAAFTITVIVIALAPHEGHTAGRYLLGAELVGLVWYLLYLRPRLVAGTVGVRRGSVTTTLDPVPVGSYSHMDRS